MVPKLFILSGIQGSGKTTLAKYLGETHNAVVYTYDDIENKGLIFKLINDSLVEGRNVVFDSLNLQRNHRVSLLLNLDIPCEKICIVMTTPIEECLRRNSTREGKARVLDEILELSATMFEPPTLDEGWDEILYCYEN